MIYGYVYRITNLVTGDCYIGQTTGTVEYRFKQHLYSARYKKAKGYSYIARAICKYGAGNFICKTVLTANSQEELNQREAFCIRVYEARYNIREAGSKGKLSEHTKVKLSIAHTGKVRGPHSAETKRKIALANIGKKRSATAKQNMSQSHLGKAAPWNYVPVEILDITTGEIHSFKSQTEASLALNQKRSAFANLVCGITKTLAKRYQVISHG